MPRAQALRRLLWRVNGVLALGVLALVAQILLAPTPEPPLPRFQFDWGEVGPREPEPCVDLTELKCECSRFWPVEPRPLPRPVVLRPPEVPTEPPLSAYEVLMWIRRPGQPDLIALSCKDPAHEARFFPMEGKPDKGVSLDGVRIEGATGLLTVSRGEDTHTFRWPMERPIDHRVVRMPGRGRDRRSDAATQRATPAAPAPSSGDLLARRDIKGVPFYGESGEVIGVRVTGIRPGGAFEKMGLRRGDIVTRRGDEPISTVVGLLTHAGADTISVRRDVGGEGREVVLRGT